MKGQKGTGSSKHRKSGHSGKSPKLRQSLKRDAERDVRKPRKTEMVGSTDELWRKQ